jgi:hypothetical protein
MHIVIRLSRQVCKRVLESGGSGAIACLYDRGVQSCHSDTRKVADSKTHGEGSKSI